VADVPAPCLLCGTGSGRCARVDHDCVLALSFSALALAGVAVTVVIVVVVDAVAGDVVAVKVVVVAVGDAVVDAVLVDCCAPVRPSVGTRVRAITPDADVVRCMPVEIVDGDRARGGLATDAAADVVVVVVLPIVIVAVTLRVSVGSRSRACARVVTHANTTRPHRNLRLACVQRRLALSDALLACQQRLVARTRVATARARTHTHAVKRAQSACIHTPLLAHSKRFLTNVQRFLSITHCASVINNAHTRARVHVYLQANARSLSAASRCPTAASRVATAHARVTTHTHHNTLTSRLAFVERPLARIQRIGGLFGIAPAPRQRAEHGVVHARQLVKVLPRNVLGVDERGESRRRLLVARRHAHLGCAHHRQRACAAHALSTRHINTYTHTHARTPSADVARLCTSASDALATASCLRTLARSCSVARSRD
jgi:hypothetical protein